MPVPKGSPPPAPLVQAYLTRDGSDAFSYLPTATGVVVVGDARNASSNTRVLIWDPRQPLAADAQSCVSFTDTGVPAQEGVALRVRQSGSAVRSVTVTKNVMFGATTLFNVHTWDTTRAGDPWRLAGQVDFGRTLRPASYPWRLCARGEGPDVKVKVWELGASEPAWTDTSRVRTVTVGADWTGAGATGFYVGHLGAGRWARLDDLAAAAVVVPSPTTTVPTTTSTTTTSTSTTVP